MDGAAIRSHVFVAPIQDHDLMYCALGTLLVHGKRVKVLNQVPDVKTKSQGGLENLAGSMVPARSRLPTTISLCHFIRRKSNRFEHDLYL